MNRKKRTVDDWTVRAFFGVRMMVDRRTTLSLSMILFLVSVSISSVGPISLLYNVPFLPKSANASLSFVVALFGAVVVMGG